MHRGCLEVLRCRLCYWQYNRWLGTYVGAEGSAEHPLVPTSYPGAISVFVARLVLCWSWLLSVPQPLAAQRGVERSAMRRQ